MFKINSSKRENSFRTFEIFILHIPSTLYIHLSLVEEKIRDTTFQVYIYMYGTQSLPERLTKCSKKMHRSFSKHTRIYVYTSTIFTKLTTEFHQFLVCSYENLLRKEERRFLRIQVNRCCNIVIRNRRQSKIQFPISIFCLADFD